MVGLDERTMICGFMNRSPIMLDVCPFSQGDKVIVQSTQGSSYTPVVIKPPDLSPGDRVVATPEQGKTDLWLMLFSTVQPIRNGDFNNGIRHWYDIEEGRWGGPPSNTFKDPFGSVQGSWFWPVDAGCYQRADPDPGPQLGYCQAVEEGPDGGNCLKIRCDPPHWHWGQGGMTGYYWTLPGTYRGVKQENVYLSGYRFLQFQYKMHRVLGGSGGMGEVGGISEGWLGLWIDDTRVWTGTAADWTPVAIDVSGYVGYHTLKFLVYGTWWDCNTRQLAWIDKIKAIR